MPDESKWNGTVTGLPAIEAEPFPRFAQLSVDIPLTSRDWTIWPEQRPKDK